MKISKNQLIGFMFIIMGLLAAFATSRIAVKTTLSTAGDVGPRCFPYIASAGIVLSGLGIIASRKDDSTTAFLSKGELLKGCQLMAVLIIYLVAIKYLGFLVSTPFFLFVMIRMLKGAKKTLLWVDIVFSIVFSGIIYYVFVSLLNIMLPRGLIF